MCRDTQEARQHEICDPKSLLRFYLIFPPIPILFMPWSIRPKSIHQQIDVNQNQRISSITSSSDAALSRSTPGRNPLPLNVGSFKDPLTGFVRRLITSRRASSITAVKVWSESAASFLVSAKSASSSRTVVLMHQSIPPTHQYVNYREARTASPPSTVTIGVVISASRLTVFCNFIEAASYTSSSNPAE